MSDTEQIQTATIERSTGRSWHVPRAISALGHRNFAIYWFGQVISNTGTWMQGMALGWLLFELTGSRLNLGLLGMVSSLPVLFLTLPLGVVADRFNKRKITILTQSLAMVQAFILAALNFTHRIEVWHIFVLAAFMGIIYAIDVPARQAMVVELVGKDDLLNAVSLNSAVFNITRIIGPAAAGWIVAAYGTANCFLFNGISYIAVVVSLMVIRSTPLRSNYNGESTLSQIREGLALCRKHAVIRHLLILTAVASIFLMQYGTQIPAFAVQIYKVGARGQGMMMSAAGLGAFLAASGIASFAHRFSQGTIVTFGSILAPIGLIAFALSPSYHLALACLVVAGFGVMSLLAVSNSMIQTSSPDNLRGRVMSARTFVFMGFAPFGALQVGAVAQYVGLREAIVIGGVISLGTSVYLALRSDALKSAGEEDVVGES